MSEVSLAALLALVSSPLILPRSSSPPPRPLPCHPQALNEEEAGNTRRMNAKSRRSVPVASPGPPSVHAIGTHRVAACCRAHPHKPLLYSSQHIVCLQNEAFRLLLPWCPPCTPEGEEGMLAGWVGLEKGYVRGGVRRARQLAWFLRGFVLCTHVEIVSGESEYCSIFPFAMVGALAFLVWCDAFFFFPSHCYIPMSCAAWCLCVCVCVCVFIPSTPEEQHCQARFL